MSESSSDLDRLRQALNAQPSSSANAAQQPIRRLARALLAENVETTTHARVLAEMPAMAAAELRGDRLAQLFPDAVAHMDVCESCSLEYAQLLDMLLEMETFVPASAAPPALSPTLQTALRIRDWVMRTAQQLLHRAQITYGDVNGMLDTLLEGLSEMTTMPAPVQAQQWALGYGGEDDETPLVMATWFATQTLATQATAVELQSLADGDALGERARQIAEETARQMKLAKPMRSRFVEDYVRIVLADPQVFVALGRPS